jgi:GTPase SAR1 family protein
MQVEILDTAGQDAYTPLRETFMHTGDGFLLVYSIVDDQTLEELREIREQILRVHPDRKVTQFLLPARRALSPHLCSHLLQVPMMVVGNKADMKKRVVSKQEGKTLADEFGAGFLEISAKENLRVKEAFQTLVQQILVKSPKAGHDSDGAAGVFGGGKADP